MFIYSFYLCVLFSFLEIALPFRHYVGITKVVFNYILMGYRRDSEGFGGILVQVLLMPLTSHSKERRGVPAIDMLLWFLMWPGPLGFPFSHQRSSIKCHNSTPCTLAIASCYPPLISLFSCFPDSTLCLQKGIQQKKAWKVCRKLSSRPSDGWMMLLSKVLMNRLLFNWI